tara:strand:+ start:157 stop:825 length:669 start_codon:yes stop_codon:yes gene_type:complete
MSAGNGKKKMGQLKGYKCFTRTNNSGAVYTTCKDDAQQLRIASAKKKRELYKKPTKPTTVKPKKKSSPKPKKPRGRPKAPPKVKKAPAKRGRPSTGKTEARKAEADKKRKARLEKKYKVMTPKKVEEDTNDGDNEMLVQKLDLSKTKEGVKWKGKQLYINDATGKIYDPSNGDIVGKRIVVLKGGKRETMYKIDKDFATPNIQSISTPSDLRFFGRMFKDGE